MGSVVRFYPLGQPEAGDEFLNKLESHSLGCTVTAREGFRLSAKSIHQDEEVFEPLSLRELSEIYLLNQSRAWDGF